MAVDTNEIVMLIFGWVFVIALVSIIGGFLHVRRERLLTHAERMKALELGREVPDSAAVARIKAAFGASAQADEDAGTWSPARKCFGVALWVPIGVALLSTQAHHGGTAYAMWAAS